MSSTRSQPREIRMAQLIKSHIGQSDDVHSVLAFSSSGRAVFAKSNPPVVHDINMQAFIKLLQENMESNNAGPTIHIPLNGAGRLELRLFRDSRVLLRYPIQHRTVLIDLEDTARQDWKDTLTACADRIEDITLPDSRFRAEWKRYHTRIEVPATLWNFRLRWPAGNRMAIPVAGTTVHACGKTRIRHLNVGNASPSNGGICWGSQLESLVCASFEDVQNLFYGSPFNSDHQDGRRFSWHRSLRVVRWFQSLPPAMQKSPTLRIPSRFFLGRSFATYGTPENYLNRPIPNEEF